VWWWQSSQDTTRHRKHKIDSKIQDNVHNGPKRSPSLIIALVGGKIFFLTIAMRKTPNQLKVSPCLGEICVGFLIDNSAQRNADQKTAEDKPTLTFGVL
jgi:hypothetical protein